MLLLALDTSGKSLSLALNEDGRLLAEMTLATGYTHSRTMMPLLDCLLVQSERNYKDLNALAVSAGPGSFTGIRIGLSAWKTLALTLGLPLLCFSSLEIMAAGLRHLPLPVLPCVDARGGRIFATLYQKGQELLPPKNISARSFLEQLSQTAPQLGLSLGQEIYVLGDGSPVALAAAEAEPSFKLVAVDPTASALRASLLAELALAKLPTVPAADLEQSWYTAEPIYLSPSQAERLCATVPTEAQDQA